MDPKLQKKYAAIQEAVNELNTMRFKDIDGCVKYRGLGFDLWYTSLIVNMEINRDIPKEYVKKRLVKKLSDPSVSTLTPAYIYEKTEEIVTEYQQFRRRKFVLATDIQLPSEFPYKRISILDNIIKFGGASDPEYYQRTIDHHILEKLPPPDSNFRRVRAYITARGEEEAFQNGLNTLNVFRALFNLFISNQSVTILESELSFKPQCYACNGPYYFLEQVDGESDTKIYFQSEFRSEVRKLNNIATKLSDPSKLRSFFRKAKRSVGQVEEMSYILDRYITVLDSRSYDDAFLRLWSVLELVTNTSGAGFSHEKTVKRASAIYQDRKKAEYLLNSMKYIRNQFVHNNLSQDISSLIMGQLKNTVENHILELLGSIVNVTRLEDYGKFLDLASTGDDLEQKKRWLQLIMKRRQII